MRSLNSCLILLLLAVLLFGSLTACGNSSNSKDSESSGKPTVLTSPEDTAPTIVPSVSLESVELIETIGIEGGGVILEGVSSNGEGATFDGKTAEGKRRWKAANAEIWAVRPNVVIPEGFPTLVTAVGTEITLYNHTEYEVTSDRYVDFSSGETYELDALPGEAGVYIRIVTVQIPRPSVFDDDPEVGAFFGERSYFFIISFE